MLNITQIPAPRVALLDPRTGLMSREWFMFFNNIYTIVGANLGVIQIENGGTGLSTYPTDGQLLIGDTVNGYVLNTLNPADGISVTNGAGTITLTNTGVLSFSAGTTGLTPAAATNGDVVIGGLLNVASGGTGQSTYTDGQLLIGNTTGNTLAKSTLTAGAGITITNGAGAITVANAGVLSFSAGTTGLTPSVATTGAVTLAGTLAVANGGTGVTTSTGTGSVVLNTSPTLVTPALGTPSALVGTNITGTASGLTAGNVTTNANLTGPITSVGNATSIASQTGTGTKFVVDNTPTLITPVLGVATATSINKMAITAPATSSTLAVADGKTFTASKTLTLTGTDSTTMTFPTTSATIARTDAAQTFTGAQTFSSTIGGATTIGVGAATPSASGAGITFPATQSASTDANTLDDYEEGTWTPTITATTGSYTTIVNQSGSYTKIGRQVTLRWYFVITNKGTGTGAAIISNLPFASNVSAGNFYAGCGYDTSAALAQICTMTTTTTIDVYKYDGTDPIIVTRGQVGQLTYFV